MIIQLIDHVLNVFSLPPVPEPPVDLSGPGCPWLCSSDGPTTPFATPLLFIADCLRICCQVVGIMCLLGLPMALANSGSFAQKMRFFGVACFILVAMTTEVVHIGDTPSYRLALNIIGLAAVTYGVLAFDWRTRGAGLMQQGSGSGAT